MIESLLDGPRERRPKYKDLALQQPPRILPSFFLVVLCVFCVCSRSRSKCRQRFPFPPTALLHPTLPNHSYEYPVKGKPDLL